MRQGRIALGVFKNIVEGVRPSYAAITVDYEMETPHELIEDSKSHAFRDFYIDSHLSEAISLTRLLDKVDPKIYTARDETGVYVSSSKYFNPEGVEATSTGAQVSGLVAARLAKVFSRSSDLH